MPSSAKKKPQKPAAPRRARRPQRTEREAPAVEWIGGCLRMPFQVQEPAPYRPSILLWRELPSGLLLGQRLTTPDQDDDEARDAALTALLEQCFVAPADGPPREPATLRVASAATANMLRAHLRASDRSHIRVDVAPTPELDDVMQSLTEFLKRSGPEPSYLEDGRVSCDAVAALFEAACELYDVAPWKTVGDDQILCVDLPDFGIEQGCISIIGALGVSRGFMLFDSVAAYGRFLDAAIAREAAPPDPDEELDIGCDYYSLTLERGADIAPSMRREITHNRWRVAAADAYPEISHHASNGLYMTVNDRDYAMMTACAFGLVSLCREHPKLFSRGRLRPVRESYRDTQGREVIVSGPFS